MNKKVLKSQRKIKAVAWTNIFAQLAFPVAAAFTPAVAAAESERKVTLTDSQLAELPVKPYVMKGSDTLNSVASSYGLTVPQLRKLNQLRTFSSSFDNVKAGQEIDVPAVQIDDILPSATDKLAAKSSFESDLASASTRTAGILQSSDISGSIAGQAKGLAVNQANQEINNWLNRSGTARAKLSVDNEGRLDGSELDMLIPLHDTPEALTFSQFGVRHIDDRTMANLGVGQRFYPAGEWMYGYNAFFDYDLRRDHSRLGFGLEMARDYLKLGANSYFRTSNWRGSPDVTDFDERPANGFDLRTEAYIPALPQLGGSLAYEQYYGDEVALFGKNNRSRNPAAFTAGLNYTPVPLLTLGVERKQGTTSGDGETLFNIGLTYDINGSWAQQIDPDAVNAKRTLAGSRYDLVERNNEIVLEYRKQEVIRLKVDSLVTGESGETKVINYSVNAKYGLGSIRWDDAALVAAGGSIKQEGDKFSVILPPYTEGGVNSWVISSVAVDKKGNSSKRAETQISVTSAAISITESLFDSQEDVIPADSQSTSVITLKLEDGAGNPVTGLASEITLEALMPGTTGTLPSFSAFREVSPGVYEAVMTAGSGFGKLTVTPSVRGVVLAPIVIDVVAPVAPVAEALKLTGSLAVGSTLNGSYTYTQPQQNDSSSRNIATLTDQSYYAWGEKGTTASAVSNGKPVSESGKIPGYTIQPSDVSKILELSLLPRNSVNVSGKIITVDTSMSKEQGNESDGGSNGGQIIDVTAPPSVSNLTMGGSLSVGGSVTAGYTFNPGTGSPKDASRYLWGESGTTASGVDSTTQAVTKSGEVPPYVVQATDTGKVLEVSVKARNDRSVEGNKATQRATDGGNNFTDGGNGGAVIDPNAIPSISGLTIKGKLEIGQSVTGSYTFVTNNGNASDQSKYLWGTAGSGASGIPQSTIGFAGQTVPGDGTVPARLIEQQDSGKVIELAVQPRNALNKVGTTVTVTSQIVGMVMSSVPLTQEYLNNFKFVTDVNGNEIQQLMWPFDGVNYAGGQFVFEPKSSFTSTTTSGVLKIVADDQVISVTINGASIPLGSTCTWNQNYCTVLVNNLNVGGNTMSVVANNAGSNGQGNPGALNLVLIAGGQNILASDPDKWDFYK